MKTQLQSLAYDTYIYCGEQRGMRNRKQEDSDLKNTVTKYTVKKHQSRLTLGHNYKPAPKWTQTLTKINICILEQI